MIDIDNLISITKNLGIENIVAELEFYKNRINSTDKDLILPLVGEFSSGKTSLINSLLDKPNLETASRATTASIFEVRFGADSCYAEIVNKEGSIENIQDVTEIKNSTLSDVELVRVYDTSTRIGSSTILVDTPGLSSNDPMHRIALSSYLPNADAILLLTDINQQITRSLLDFISSTQICQRPIYLVITKCDTKTPNEIEQAKKYIRDSINFEFADIIAISASQGMMNEFDALIAKIQQNKSAIVEYSIEAQIKNIAGEVLNIINDLLKQSDNVENINESIDSEKGKLKKIARNIDDLIKEVGYKVNENAETSYNQFRKLIFTQVDDIVKNQGRDCDQAVYGAVNSCGNMIMQKFQRNIIAETLELARQRQNSSNSIPINSLETIHISDQAFNGFSYNISLSSVGHKWDKVIGYTILAGAAIAAIAPAAAGAITIGEGTATVVATDVATDVASTAYTASKINKLRKMGEIASRTGIVVENVSNKMDEIKNMNQQLGEKVGMKRGLIETSVGWVTDFFAKSARQRAVSEYIDGTLLPEFRLKVTDLGNTILREVSTLIKQESQAASDVIRKNLEAMKVELAEKKEEYTRKMELYKEYSEQLKQYIS
ncbi:dynamin family protein [uncultured Bacteroides sp.]|uniref:dynamin family protein n=1 Tax=uncultured Bacteroides sp. TaxID=162156 RepID=UPI0026318E77|nr:dynamin family protein [uncultured Bacteroides sp.]